MYSSVRQITRTRSENEPTFADSEKHLVSYEMSSEEKNCE